MAKKKNIKIEDPVIESFHELIAIRKDRNSIYKDLHNRKGDVLVALFGFIPQQETIEDLNRFGLLNVMVNKLLRYCENFDNGGHEDSLNDLCVYSQMLKEVDREVDNGYNT